MSVITFMAFGVFVFSLGYIFSEFKNYRKCQKKFNTYIGERVSKNETDIAVMTRGDGTIERDVGEIRENINQLFGKIEDIRVEVALMNGKQ